MTSPAIGMVTHPDALFARLPIDNAEERRPVIGVGAMPTVPIGTAAGRIGMVTVGDAFFPAF
jgi:hypothetical protein